MLLLILAVLGYFLYFTIPIIIFIYLIYHYRKNSERYKIKSQYYFPFLTILLLAFEIYGYQRFFTMDYQETTLSQESQIWGLKIPKETKVTKTPRFFHLFNQVTNLEINPNLSNQYIIWKNSPIQAISYGKSLDKVIFYHPKINFQTDKDNIIKIDSFKCNVNGLVIQFSSIFGNVDLTHDQYKLSSCFAVDDNDIKLAGKIFKYKNSAFLGKINYKDYSHQDQNLSKLIKDNNALWNIKASLAPELGHDSFIQYQNIKLSFEDLYVDKNKNIRIIQLVHKGADLENYKINQCDLNSNYTGLFIVLDTNNNAYINALSYNPDYKIPEECKKIKIDLDQIKFTYEN